jgi:hypothetical protein
MRRQERRNVRERTARVQRLITAVITNPSVTLTVDTLQAWLGVQMDAAQRILARLASSGLVRELNKGVFVPGNPMGMQPL